MTDTMHATTLAVRERPILFSGPMVRTLLDGRKTQARRVVKLPHENPLGTWEPTSFGGVGCRTAAGGAVPKRAAIWHTRTGDCIGCPYGDIGDRLWVRETFATGFFGINDVHVICYAADHPQEIVRVERWRPSTHMPRGLSRITLEITGVRVERVQDISEADAVNEGVAEYARGRLAYPDDHTAVEQFAYLWDELNAAPGGGWGANPWVWVIEFRRVDGERA